MIRSILLAAICVGGLFFSATSVNAQSIPAPTGESANGSKDKAAESDQLTEITVTAQKRTESLQKAAAAITSVSGQELVTQGIQDIRTASILFPSAKFGVIGTSTHLYIRGIGSEQDRASIDPLVTMTLDGVNLPREITGNNLFDVSSIEMLPGPQSTLYGNSAAGGAVNVRSNRPVDHYEASTLLEVGNFSAVHGTAVDNVPITDTLAVRTAIDYTRHDAYYDDGGGREDQFGGKLSALYKEGDFSAYIWGSYNNTGGTPDPFVALTRTGAFSNPANPWSNSSCAPSGAGLPLGMCPSQNPLYLGPAYQQSTATIGGGEFEWQLNGFSVSVMPSYVSDNVHFLTYIGPLTNEQKLWNRQYSTEIRAVSDLEGRLRWIAGLFWIHDNQYQFLNINGGAGNPDIHNNETTYAGYGQLTYSLLDNVRIVGGLRYSSNEKSGYGCNCTAGDGLGDYFTSHHVQPHLDWKAGIETDVGRSLVYLTVQSGYNNGAYQYYNKTGLLGPQNSGPAPLVKPTELTAYTVGFKNRLFDNRVEINDEAYYYDYRDLLIASVDVNPITFGTSFYTADRTTIFGDELDIRVNATVRDRIRLSLGYLNAKPKDFVVGNPAFNYRGYQLPEAPEITATLGYSHTFELPSGAAVVFQGDTYFENGFWQTFEHSPTTHQDAYTRTGLSLTYEAASGKWSAAVWANNVENDAVKGVGAYVGLADIQGITNVRPPRTVGIRFTSSFD